MPSGPRGAAKAGATTLVQAGAHSTSGRERALPTLATDAAPSLARAAGHHRAPWRRRLPSHKERGVPGKKDVSCIFQLRFVQQQDCRHARPAPPLHAAHPVDTAPPWPGGDTQAPNSTRRARPQCARGQTAATTPDSGRTHGVFSFQSAQRAGPVWVPAAGAGHCRVFRKGKCASPSKMASLLDTKAQPGSPSRARVSRAVGETQVVGEIPPTPSQG